MQQRLEWSDAYSVLHPVLDSEHRTIADSINAIIDAVQNKSDIARLRGLLCTLKDNSTAHFAHEDAILREIVAFTSSARGGRKFLAIMGQAVVDEHLATHAQAADALEGLIRSTLQTGQAAHAHFEGLGETLVHWFVGHAIRHDAHLKALFQVVRSDCPELLSKLA